MKEPTTLKEEFDFLYEVPNHPIQQAIHDLHKGFANFFRGPRRLPDVPQEEPERQLPLSGPEADQIRGSAHLPW
jgi:hypothetical protein